MWFSLALITLLCWSGSDVFSKIGCRGDDKNAHLKMLVAVGTVMGLHAAYSLLFGGVTVSWHVALTYLPVSLLYIVSMTLGYVGLRYIELSISSPICNSSGALVAVLCFLTGTLDDSIQGGMKLAVMGAVALVCIGVIGLGVVACHLPAGGLLPAGCGGDLRGYAGAGSVGIGGGDGGAFRHGG